MVSFLDFERPIADLSAKIDELKRAGVGGSFDIKAEVEALEGKADRLMRDTYNSLTPWRKTLVARHPARPRMTAVIEALIEDYEPLAGDRTYGDDQALLGGLGRFRGQSVVVLGHEKGHDTTARLKHNFGMARPEGYRKAVRLMGLANRFRLPVLTFVDTPGAFPGVEAEERGQAEAIARSIAACLDLETPLIATILGEGGSGGAVALAAANRVLMYEHAIYSVISPEGCASILWRTAEKASDAADALKITAQDLLKLGMIDEIVPEPIGGAHRAPALALATLANRLEAALKTLSGQTGQRLKNDRREKYLRCGAAL